MTIREMHIGIEQKIDELAANIHEVYFPAEVDQWIAEAEAMFIRKNAPNKPYWEFGFQEVKENYHNLEELLKRKTLKLFQHSATNQYYVELPDNLYSLVDADINGFYNCTNPSWAFEDITLYTANYEFEDDTTPTAHPPYYNNLQISILYADLTEDTVFTYQNHPEFAGGINDLSLKFHMIASIRDDFNTNTINSLAAYWEQYGETFTKETFVVVYIGKKMPSSILTRFNGVTYWIDSFSTSTRKVLDTDNSAGTAFTSNSTRLVKREKLGRLKSHEYAKTSWKSPLITIEDGILYVHANDEFVPETIDLSYIRRPRRVSFADNVTSEVRGDINKREITSIAAELIKAHNGHQTYPAVKDVNTIK